MSKVLRIQKGGYKVIAEEIGSEILLNPGPNNSGKVTVTGDLIVEGNSTYVNSTNLEIEDRIIRLNRGEQGPGGGQSAIVGVEPMSGIEIDRGNVDALFVFDESPMRGYVLGGDSLDDKNAYPVLESFVSKSTLPNKSLFPITTNRIQTYGVQPNRDLSFFVGYEGLLKVDYLASEPNEDQLYDAYHVRIKNLIENPDPTIQAEGNNSIPNIQFIREYVRAEAGQAVIQQFFRYTDLNTYNTYSGAQAKDISQTGDGFSGVLFTVGSDLGSFPRTPPGDLATIAVARIGKVGTDQGLVVGKGGPADKNLRVVIDIADNTIIKTDNTDLIIEPDTGNIIIKSVVHVQDLSPALSDPTPITGENIVFSRAIQGSGGTGLFFTNNNTTGELCSAANALVYGLIF
jgi:hypothetical protein